MSLPARGGDGFCATVRAEVRRTIARRPEAAHVAKLLGLADPHTETLYDGLEVRIRPGEIFAVTGPSGAGKTVLLEAVLRQNPTALRLDAARAGLRAPAACALRGGTRAQRLRQLARCGLADAAALVTPAGSLSGGQRHRLALARMLHAASRRAEPTLAVADEFCTPLDTPTARVLCMGIRRWIRRSRVALLVATPRAELLDALRPDRVLRKPLGGPASIETPVWRGRAPGPHRWPVRRGTLLDYDALAAFHYLAARPAAHKRVYVVRTDPAEVRLGGPAVAAVLVVGPPLRNCRGRNAALGERYLCPDRRAALAKLNADIECISRVIVHPVYRGCGLAVRLVRHALATARTPYVEALAAMGDLHAFFRRAGMERIGRYPGRRGGYTYYLADSTGRAAASFPSCA